MTQQRQLEEVLSWRLVCELWRWFPDRYFLIESHPGGGQSDCLSLIEFAAEPWSALDVNRGGGSVHVHQGRNPQSWSDWVERMLGDPRRFLNEICDALGIDAPQKLPMSTPATISFRYIGEFLTHALGRLEQWECRNGFFDTSGYGGGKQESWFTCFPAVKAGRPVKPLADGRFSPAYGYWFLLRNTEPMLCVDFDGQLYTRDGQVHDLATLYAKHKRMWSLIADTALELLP